MADIPAYEDITETTGLAVTPEAASMLATRYAEAVRLAAGRRVLELGCGAGLGLGVIAHAAGLLVGGDYSRALLRNGRAHYGDRIPLVRLSAESLPFRSGRFDLVLFFEASYYVPNMERAFDEIARVLAAKGEVLFVNANPERADFVRSPLSVRYHTASELREALERRGFRVTVAGAFAVGEDTNNRGPLRAVTARILPFARRTLERLGLVPTTLAGRARLKRLLYGRMRLLPPEIPEGFAPEAPLTPLSEGPVHSWKVIYVRGASG